MTVLASWKNDTESVCFKVIDKTNKCWMQGADYTGFGGRLEPHPQEVTTWSHPPQLVFSSVIVSLIFFKLTVTKRDI